MDSEEEFYSASSGDEEETQKVTAKSVVSGLPKDPPSESLPPVPKKPSISESSVFVEIRKPSTEDSSEVSVTFNDVEKESSSSEEFVVTEPPLQVDASAESAAIRLDPESIEVLASAKQEPTIDADDEVEASEGWDDWGSPGDKTLETENTEEEVKELSQEKSNKESTEDEANWDWGNDGWDIENKEKDPPEVKSKLDLKPKSSQQQSAWGLASALGKTFSSAVENTFGLPSAEEFAQKARIADANEEQLDKEEPKKSAFEALAEGPSSSTPALPSFSLFSGLVSGGLDALEAIGKKTFETLTVKDKKGRSRLFFDQSSEEPLSDLLKRIKEEQSTQDVRANIVPTIDFFSLIGATTAMQNIEALELLSVSKGVPANSRAVTDLVSAIPMKEVKNSTDFELQIKKLLRSLCSSIDANATAKAYEEVCNQAIGATLLDPEEAYKSSLNALVSITETLIQLVAKVTQLLFATTGQVNQTAFLDLSGLLRGALLQFESIATSLPPGVYQGDDIATRYLVDCESAQELMERIFRLSIIVLLI